MMTLSVGAVYVDNDDASGYSNSCEGFNETLSSSSYYRGDARRNGGSSGSYSWYFNGSGKGSTSSFDVSMYAYVNDASFKNTSSRYVANGNNTWFTIGYLDQNAAYGGWNYIGRTTVTPLYNLGYNSIAVNYVTLIADSTYYTGADGVQVLFP